MIRPIQRGKITTLPASARAGDVDVLRETLLAIGSIPMLSVEEEERLALGIQSAKSRLRRSMLISTEVAAGVASLLEGVASGSERLDRALDVTLAELKDKDRLRAIAQTNADTLRGMISRQGTETKFDSRQARKAQKLVDEALVRTSRIEGFFEQSDLAGNKRYLVARRRYEVLRNQMVSANLRLAVSVAKKYQNGNVPLLDLIQEGCEGLIRAAEKFKPSLGFKFSTYSVWWIQQRVRAALAEKSRLIRIGEAAANRIRKLRADVAEQSDDQARGIMFEDLPIGDAPPNRREELRKSFYVCRDILSLDVPLNVHSDTTRAETIATESEDFDSGLIQDERRQALGQAFQNLTDRECEVLRLRFGLEDGTERNLAEVGRILEISRERVRQIEQVSLKKLRGRLKPEHVN